MGRASATLAASALAALLTVGTASGRTLPDPYRNPGLVNPNISQSNIKRTICKAGWTKTIRPPSSYTTALKRQQIAEYRYRDRTPGHYEEDHIISLQLGGHPTDPRNLWPQPYNVKCGARVKDVVETKLKRLVCSGDITLIEAQQMISTNWAQAYNRHVDTLSCPSP